RLLAFESKRGWQVLFESALHVGVGHLPSGILLADLAECAEEGIIAGLFIGGARALLLQSISVAVHAVQHVQEPGAASVADGVVTVGKFRRVEANPQRDGARFERWHSFVILLQQSLAILVHGA